MTQTCLRGRPTIGVLAGWQYYWTATPLSYLSPIYQGIRLAAAELGCNLLLGCGMGASASAEDLLRPAWPIPSPEVDFVPIGPWNTDGLILVNPLHSETRSRYVQELIAAGHPVVFVGSGERGPTILADNAGGIMQAMRHLVEHGHRHIAFIAGSVEDMEGDSGDRLEAYRAAQRAFALDDDPRLLAFGQHTFGSGYAAMQQMLSTGLPLSAVLASNDESALGAIRALAEAGRRVPEDIAVIGFDDRPESSVQQPALSSVQVPLFKMGYRAVELLLRRMAGSAAADERVLVPTRLIGRESCGCGRSAVLADVLDATAARLRIAANGVPRSRLAQRMAAAVLAETQALGEEETVALCQHLVETFTASVAQNDTTGFQRTLDEVLRQAIARGDDAHLWQVAISVLRAELPSLLAGQPGIASLDVTEEGREILNQARITISAAMRQQHRQVVVDQRWTGDRIGQLTAQLLNTLDETQVYDTLARALPELGIDLAWVALLDAEGDDPVAWSLLRSVTSPQRGKLRFPSREFPPADWVAQDAPFSLALLPLIAGRRRAGYVALDAEHLELNGAIAQELAAAVNTAQLYREATEGRRLAEEADQMKSRFLSTVSHELRTPLNLIVGLTGLLMQQDRDNTRLLPEALQQDIERIHANAQHLGGLIGDVLDMASSDAGQLRLTWDYVDLGQVLRAVAETGRQMAADKGLAWRTDLPDSGPWVWGDAMRLRQVALNLVSNAVKFTERGEVSVVLTTGPQTVTVAVRDTGLGIPPAEQQAIFDEFRRSERSVTRGYRGLGLGLAICQRLIALHDGTMEVESSGVEGMGSSFHFTLPTVALPTAARARPAPPAALAPSVLVLVPPEGSSSGHLRSHLEQRGFRVQVERLADARAWLARLSVDPPLSVVLDVGVASDYGWNAFKAIKDNASLRNIPVVFYAAERDSGAVMTFDYLTKPVEMAELTRALDQRWLTAEAGQSTRTFLIVDDDPDTLNMYERIVQAHAPDSRVLRAHNGRVALEVLEQTPVDLVLLDLMMPEMDGFALLEAMRARAAMRDIPVIVVTGQVLTETQMARLNQGVAAVLSKGLFGLDETLEMLDAALERQQKLSSEAQRLVRKAMAYIHENYQQPLSRQDLARHVGMSDDYLTFCFRQELGLTPIAYLNRYRVTRAKQLLKETSKSITEIALDVGFSDSGYFSRVFRKEAGMSPDAFRRREGAA
jgi:signal transduction histidine kinase/DNA-binding LacI/PurR family transcriptional regulator/AraC-like DNA-binding protein